MKKSTAGIKLHAETNPNSVDRQPSITFLHLAEGEIFERDIKNIANLVCDVEKNLSEVPIKKIIN